MKTKIIRIGNSKGIRLPKPVLEQVGLAGEVDLEIRNGELIISPSVRIRDGWASAAIALAERGEDELLDPWVPTDFDVEDWKW
jgi:antitoxin MazE